MEEQIREILRQMGENPERKELLETPKRVAKSLRFLTRGYQEDPKKLINGAIFDAPQKEMVILKDVNFFSLCEHHLLPFFGKCHLAYIPNGKIIGLSKLGRLIDMFARRLQVQERLTQQIADTLNQAISPLGVGVVMEAQHLCMQMRGVEKQQSVAITSAMLGAFQEQYATRAEFMSLTQSS